MANCCTFTMVVVGNKDSVREVERRLIGEPEDQARFGGIESCQAVDDPNLANDADVIMCTFAGACKTSVSVAMGDGLFSFYKQNVRNTGSPWPYVSLEETARDLDCDIEVFSKGCDDCLAEHFVYEAGTGELLCEEYMEDEYPASDEYEDESGMAEAVTEADYDGVVYGGGGFDESPTISIENWRQNHPA